MARRQGRGAGTGRLPLRHGADDSDRCRRCCAASSPRPAALSRTRSISFGSIRNGARFSTMAARSISIAIGKHMRADARAISRPAPRDGYEQFPRLVRSGCIASRATGFSGGRSAACATCSTSARLLQLGHACATCSRCGWGAASPRACARICRIRASRRWSITLRNTSAPRRTSRRRCSAASRTCRRDEGIWYPRGGTRAVPAALAKLARRTRRGDSRPAAGCAHIATARGAVSGVELETASSFRLRAVVSNCDAVRTHRELLGGDPQRKFRAAAAGYEPACSGVVLYLGLRRRYAASAASQFRLLARSARGVRRHLSPRRTGAGPDLLRLRAGHDRSRRRPARRRSALRARAHAVPAPASRLARDVPGIPPHDPGKAARAPPACDDLEDEIVTESALTPQDIHDRYHVLNGAIYGLASHGRWTGAFKPSNRSPDLRGLYLAGGAAHPGPGHADGADVGLDRRRRARSRSRCVKTGGPLPEISQPLLRFFGRYAEGYLRRHFHTVRLLKGAATA